MEMETELGPEMEMEAMAMAKAKAEAVATKRRQEQDVTISLCAFAFEAGPKRSCRISLQLTKWCWPHFCHTHIRFYTERNAIQLALDSKIKRRNE